VELPEQWVVTTDPQLLHIVLINLLENACKYARPDSPIVLSLQAAWASDGVTQQACFSVSNEPGAAGWPDAGKVFDKYYRSPHARRQAGSGLGLFLVRNLVGVLGGRIAYAPDDRQVKFMFHLPV
jgi:K+-sensing histidine kinase KdpD